MRVSTTAHYKVQRRTCEELSGASVPLTLRLVSVLPRSTEEENGANPCTSREVLQLSVSSTGNLEDFCRAPQYVSHQVYVW